MAIRHAVPLIADVGGYTHYMHRNRKHPAHAQRAVAGLLEAVIDAGKGLKLAKLEGLKPSSRVLLATRRQRQSAGLRAAVTDAPVVARAV